MPVGRYVLVSTDPTDRLILAGPFLWDGVSRLVPPEGQRVITEAIAVSDGYTHPLPPIRETNASTLRDRARQALSVNAAYLALPAPTNPQIATQVVRLTKQVNGLIRLLVEETSDLDGT
jgi:hypothetical protein